jgi:hypothetical protein
MKLRGLGDRMAQNRERWGEDWNSTTWASARGLWRRPTSEEEEVDDRSWCEAACEAGGLFRVLWCEFCQLFGDLLPRRRPTEPLAPAPAPEQAES